jgi:glycogen operon protein
MLSYRLLLLERDGQEFRAASSYPRRAVACVSTHDLPTFRGWVEGADIAERASLGLTAAPMAEREAELAALRRAVGNDEEDLAAAAHHLIASTPCDLAYVQAEDLGGERVAVNLPGTDRERPNWRRRIATPVEALFTSNHALTLLDEISLGRLADNKAA